jgi:phosphohistidine phosphatase
MKRLILIRHAKSAWDNPALDDHDRPLADRGLHDAPKMANRLLARDIYPDLLISSTALRAKATAEFIARALGHRAEEIVLERSLFHASYRSILGHLRSQDDRYNTIMIFGHNPGLTDLVNYLGGDIDNLPTCGQYGFMLKSTYWNDLRPETVDTWFFDYPKKRN